MKLAIAAILLGFALPASAADKDSSKKVLKHVVLFQFKEDASKAEVDEVVQAFARLPEQIDVIRGFEWGTDVSAENKTQGYTHLFLVTFDDAQGRDEYLPHPAHQKFVQLLRPRLKKALVFDYLAEK